MSRRKPRAKRTRSNRPGLPDPPSRLAVGSQWTWLGGLLIVGAVVVAYGPAVTGGYVWDDDDYVTKNIHLRTLSGLGSIWFDVGATHQYYPLVHTSFWIEYHLWQLHPLGYHLNNVLLHAVGAVLLWLVLRRLSLPGAWLAAAVFALHPVQVESVAWITERKNVLSGVFYLASLMAYIRFCGLGADRPADPPPWRFYASAVALFCCALLSKTVTCSLPAVVLVLLWWKRRRLGRADVLPLVPMLVLGMAAALLTAWMEKHTVGAQGQEWSLTFAERCLVAGRAVWFYLAKLVCPAKLTFIYPRWQIDAGLWWQYVYPLAAVAVPMSLWLLRRRLGKGPLAAALFFGGTLLPALGFVDVYPMRFSFVADHFAYLAGIGPITVFAVLATRVLRVAPAAAIGRFVPAGVLVVLGALTWHQASIYRDEETLWRDTLVKNPSAWIAHNNLGNLVRDRGKIDEALEHYRAALRLNPVFTDALNNLGAMLADRGRVGEAIELYRQGLRLRPNRAALHFNLGEALARQGNQEQAVAEYNRTLEIEPTFSRAHNALGIAMAARGQIGQAIEHYRQALGCDPGHAEAHNNLAISLAMQDRLDEAVTHFRRAAQLKPDFAEALGGLGLALAETGSSEEAMVAWRQVLRIEPANVTVRCLLGDHLLQLGRVDQARAEYRQALRTDPNCGEAHRGLAAVAERAAE